MGTSQSSTSPFQGINNNNHNWFNFINMGTPDSRIIKELEEINKQNRNSQYMGFSQERSEEEMKRNLDQLRNTISQPNIKVISLNEYDEKKFKEDLEKQVLPLYPSPESKIIKTHSKRPTKPAPQTAQKIELHAQPTEAKNEAKVNASDGRTQVFETTKFPNSVHGVIAFKIKNVTKWGTGILIGPHIVLTAGHNLYDHDTKNYTDGKSLQFLPGMNGQMLPFGIIEVEQYFVSPGFIKNKEKEDYGLLILKKRIGELTGYFGLACLDSEEIKKKRINITGYPGDKVASKPNTYELWGMEGEAAHIDRNQGHINYLIDTGAGQSGSGVWFKEGEDYYVCGIHITGTQFVNTATLLTRSVYKQIHAWIQQQADSKESLLRLEGDKRLSFTDKKINARCISLLIRYDLDDLRALNLARKKIEDKEIQILARNSSWVNLTELYLWGNKIGAEGAKALAQNNFWTNLSQLDLGCNNIGSQGAKALAENSSWKNLRQLHLDDNQIDDEGAKALAQNKSWVNLSKLYFSNNSIGAEGAKALAQNPCWVNLSNLYLDIMSSSGEGRIPLRHEYHRRKNFHLSSFLSKSFSRK